MPKEETSNIKTIVISGLGVMGASLAMAIRQNCPHIQILGYDTKEVLAEASRLNIIDKAVREWPLDCTDADIIFLATPLHILKQHLQDLNGAVSGQTIITDLGSTKQELSDLVRQIDFDGIYIGGHPMTGAEKSGIKAANPLLYENAVYVLTSGKHEHSEIVNKKLIPLLKAIKSRILFLEANVHDKILASVSHLPQLAAIALVNLAGGQNKPELPVLELAAGGFRDLTRIASSSIDIWQDIISSNKENVREALSRFIGLLQDELNTLDNLKEPFESANDYRSRLPKQNKGFLSPLSDILVYVNDEMGVVAKIANALSARAIDIRDIELLKIREKEGGVFRLSLADETEAAQSIEILNKIGYKAFMRE